MNEQWRVTLEPMEGHDDDGNNIGGVGVFLVRELPPPTLPDPRPSETATSYRTRVETIIESWAADREVRREVSRVAYDRKRSENAKQAMEKVLGKEVEKATSIADKINEHLNGYGTAPLR